MPNMPLAVRPKPDTPLVVPTLPIPQITSEDQVPEQHDFAKEPRDKRFVQSTPDIAGLLTVSRHGSAEGRRAVAIASSGASLRDTKNKKLSGGLQYGIALSKARKT